MVLLSTAFAVYLGCFIVVVQRAALKTDLKRVGYLSIVILSFPLLYASTSAFARFWVYFQREPGGQCYLYSESSKMGQAVQFLQLLNGLFINVFLLRVLFVAAMLKSESREEEVKAQRNINLLKIVYLPAYAIIQCTIYGA